MSTSSVPKSQSLNTVRGLSVNEVARLKKVGIDSTKELLEAAPTTHAERKLAEATGISQDRIREVVNRADLLQVSGVGPATADLFENAGVNSARELANRNPLSLHSSVGGYVDTRPELNYRKPSSATVNRLVGSARALEASPVPTTMQEAKGPAAELLHSYIDDVLFSNHPDGASFRENIVSWQDFRAPQIQKRMHDEVDAFLNDPNSSGTVGFDEQMETPTAFVLTGRIYGLYTEVTIPKDGSPGRVFVEID